MSGTDSLASYQDPHLAQTHVGVSPNHECIAHLESLLLLLVVPGALDVVLLLLKQPEAVP